MQAHDFTFIPPSTPPSLLPLKYSLREKKGIASQSRFYASKSAESQAFFGQASKQAQKQRNNQREHENPPVGTLAHPGSTMCFEILAEISGIFTLMSWLLRYFFRARGSANNAHMLVKHRSDSGLEIGRELFFFSFC